MNEVVVIGGGLMGSSAAWQLAQIGWKVHLIEQQGPEYSYGSSFGTARIARCLGPDGDLWGFLHNKTVEEVHQLIHFLQQHDAVEHKIEDIYTTSPVNYVFFDQQAKLGGFEAVLQQRVSYCQYAFNSIQSKSLFGLQLPSTAKAWLREQKPYSGTINPEALIQKLHRAIVLKGGTISYHTSVDSIAYKEQQYHLSVDKDDIVHSIQTNYLLCAAGAYNAAVLSAILPSLSNYIRPQRVYVAYFSFTSEDYGTWSTQQKARLLEMYPAIYFNDELSFAMVESVDANGIPIIKIGGHFCRSNYTDTDKVWQQPLSAPEIKWAMDETLQHLQCAAIPTDSLFYQSGYSCIYSLTLDEVPIVSKMQKDDNMLPGFVLMGGMSGVGAKGCMAYGKIAASLLSDTMESLHESYNFAIQQLAFNPSKPYE